MKTLIINSKYRRNSLDFILALAGSLKEKGSVLIVSTRRDEGSLEDSLNRGGILAFDLADYLLDKADLDKVIFKEYEGLDFIIAPYLDGKIDLKKEHITKLINDISYDYLILDSLDPNLIDDKESVRLVKASDDFKEIEEDSFFIDEVSEEFDIRLFKDQIKENLKNYLGQRKVGEDYRKISKNLLDQTYPSIGSLSFFEKLKLKFKK